MQQVAKIAADADVHPQDALANAQAVPRPNLRAAALEAVARANSKKNASVARSALAKQVDLASQLDLPVQLHNLSDAARLYLDMGETDDAKKTIERGLKAADEMYKQDDNADDPNKALKAYWPSTEAYRSLLRIAGQISPAWALKLAGEISDPEIKVLVQIALAGAWLDVPGGPSTTMSSTKKGNQIMMSMDD
jgi:hypothetical protein